MNKAVMLFFLGVLLAGCGESVKIVKFDTRPEAPFMGDSVTLYWEVQHATEVTLDGAPVSTTGQKRVLLNRSQDFILKATGSHSEAQKKIEIVALPK